MSFRANLLKVYIVIVLMVAGCKENPTEPTTTKASSISGTVLDAGNNPLVFARVIDIGSLAQVDTSKTDGSYTLTMELSDNYNTSVYAILPGYSSDTQKVSLTPSDNKTGVNIHMKIVDSSKIISGNSGRAASIGLMNQTTKSILLKGGINQSCTLTFLVVDSLNRPVTGTNRCKVKFSISVSNPSGEYIKPDTGQTDPLTGQVSTIVFSGTKPNAILVTAQVIDPIHKITATASLTEGTGLPDGNHVSIAASKFNIAGRVYDGLSTKITMTVNDQFGNPVDDGTPVSFVTNGGGITNNAFTSNGMASATLTSGGGNPPIGGLVTVTAEVKGDTSVRKSDSSIVRTIQILFSGHTTVSRSSNSVNFVLDGNMNFFDFTVSDDNGKPLVAGSTINVVLDAGANDLVSKNLQLKGNQITIGDTKDTSQTHFRVWVVDNNAKDSLTGTITFKINVISQNDNYPIPDQDWFTGMLLHGTTSGTTFGVPASISLADSSSRTLYLSETQLPDTSTRLTFIVRDGTGTPINVSQKAPVSFFLLQAPIGTHLSTVQDSTGAGGAVSVTVSAGNTPGIAQVAARTTDGSGNFITALSMPIQVAHGLPDSNQIFLSLAQNMFNNMGNQVGTITVNLADVNGNFPAPEYVFFNTTGGVINPGSVLSDASGRASAALYGGKVPIDPVKGFGNVSVYVKVHGGVNVTRKAPFVFSGAPVVTTLNVPASDTIIISDGGSMDIDYKIADANGIPLAQGNTITVSVSGFASSGIALSNAVNITTGTIDTNNTTYIVRLSDAVANGGISGNFDVYIAVNGPSGSTTRHFYGVLRAAQQINVPSPEALKAAQIAYVGITASDIYVDGVGALENAVITYEVHDSLGMPVAASPKYGASFSISFFPNSTIGGGTAPHVIPATDSTDSQGQLRASIISGTEAGVVELVAQIVLASGNIISSQPVKITVHAGFPDQNHFSILTSRFVFPGWTLNCGLTTFTVVVGDTFSNPVSKGTAVYFHSQAGVIETGFNDFQAYTDKDGMATVKLLPVNPGPDVLPYYDPTALNGRKGGHWVYAQTQNRNGGQVIDSVLVVWNEGPIIVVQSPPSITMQQFHSSASFTLEVTDANGNPLPDGTTFTVSFVIPAGTSGVAFDTYGNIPTLPIPVYAAGRFPGPGTTIFTFGVTDNSTPPGANATTCKITISVPCLGSTTIAIPVTLTP
jgi:hypothetical protein